jgi:small subunit ribosomal protein S11
VVSGLGWLSPSASERKRGVRPANPGLRVFRPCDTFLRVASQSLSSAAMSSSWLTGSSAAATVARSSLLRGAARQQPWRALSTTTAALAAAEGDAAAPVSGLYSSPSKTVPPSSASSDAPPKAPADGYPPSNPWAHAPRPSSASSARLLERVQEVKYYLHVQCTENNSIVTLTDARGNTVERGWFSGGSCGLKGANRSGYEAGYQCAVRAFKRIQELEESTKAPIALELFYKGFGKGREAFVNALTLSEGEAVRKLVVRMTDRTGIKIGGTRAKKVKRR